MPLYMTVENRDSGSSGLRICGVGSSRGPPGRSSDTTRRMPAIIASTILHLHLYVYYVYSERGGSSKVLF